MTLTFVLKEKEAVVAAKLVGEKKTFVDSPLCSFMYKSEPQYSALSVIEFHHKSVSLWSSPASHLGYSTQDSIGPQEIHYRGLGV